MRATFSAGLVLQAAGAAGVAVAELPGSCRWGRARRSLHERVRSALRRRRAERVVPRNAGLVAAPTLVYACATEGRSGAARSALLTAAFLLALAGVLGAATVTLLAGWELMTLLPAAAILVVRREPVRAAVRSYVAITHLGGAGVWIALLVLAQHDAIGGRSARALGRRRWSRSRRSSGSARKPADAAAHLAAARPSGRARARLGADVGGDDQGRAIYGLIRVGSKWRAAPPLVGRAAGAGAALRRSAACSTRSSSTTSSGCSRSPRSRSRDHRLGARRRDPAAAGAATGRARVRCGAAAHRQPRRVQGAAVPRRGRVRAGPGTLELTSSAACCGACRGPARRSWSARGDRRRCRR